MHHFIYPSKDTYITSRTGLDDKNFGIDEILQIGTTNTPLRVISTTRDYLYADKLFTTYNATSFTGIFTGSFAGTSSFVGGSISGSGLAFSASYFSGAIDGTSSIRSGSVSGSAVIGYITGSVLSPYQIGVFTGQLTGSDVCMTGTGSGTDTRAEEYWTTDAAKFIDRALLKFDLTTIFASISSSTIVNPRFSLKVKICNEYDLPITYKIYALPISQSWNMGDGYYSDGGSDEGVNWLYRDNNDGITWYNTATSGVHPSIDFITYPARATASFGYGGGTWYTSSICSQSFQYESSDINMDVTPIVMAWYSGSLPNEGFLLVHSDELQSTGSGFVLKFFSRDTNTIYYPYLDVKWDNTTFDTGSLLTGSVTITTVIAGVHNAMVQSSSMFFTSSNGGSGNGSGNWWLNPNGINNGDGFVAGTFSGSTFLIFTQNYSASVLLSNLSASGFVDGVGLSGNIYGVPVYGFISASVSVSSSMVTGPCENSFTSQFLTGSFYNGPFSGSTFTAYYVDYKIENAFLYGRWTSNSFLGATINIPFPMIFGTYGYAYINGPYFSGTALGTYTLDGPGSASYLGQFIDGNLVGNSFLIQFTGSIYTSSYSYTSSVTPTSSVLFPVNVGRPFTVALMNVHPTYKAGDIVKIGVFGRKQFPLKYFGKSTQQEQYLVPEYLPTSSYYALKDNMTDEIVVDFDNYTKISCEYPYGNYFVIDTTSLPQDRYYRVLIRVEDGQTIYTFDSGKVFKVTR